MRLIDADKLLEDLKKTDRYFALKFDIEDAPTVDRPQGKWEYIKEHITELRDADGKLNQKQTCQFILNLMGVIEEEGDEE